MKLNEILSETNDFDGPDLEPKISLSQILHKEVGIQFIYQPSWFKMIRDANFTIDPKTLLKAMKVLAKHRVGLPVIEADKVFGSTTKKIEDDDSHQSILPTSLVASSFDVNEHPIFVIKFSGSQRKYLVWTLENHNHISFWAYIDEEHNG